MVTWGERAKSTEHRQDSGPVTERLLCGALNVGFRRNRLTPMGRKVKINFPLAAHHRRARRV